MIEAPPHFAIADAQYRQLTPTLRRLARDDETARLARAIALSQGFSLQLASCDSPLLAQALILCLATQVPALRGAGCKMVRLVPTRPDEVNEALDPQPLDPQALGREVFDRLFAADAEPRAIFLDATDSRADDRPAWLWLFQRLNERRNHLRVIGAALILLLPPDLEPELPVFAPDLWSVRSVATRFTTIPDPSATTEPLALSATVPAPLQSMTATTEALALPRLEDEESPSFRHDVAKLRTELDALLHQPGPHGKRALVATFVRLANEVDEETLSQAWAQIRPAIESAPEELRAELAFGLIQTLSPMLPSDDIERLARRALPVLEQQGNDDAIAAMLGRVVDGYLHRDNLDAALRVLREDALPRMTAPGLHPGARAEILSRQAAIYLQRGDLAAAEAIMDDPALPLERVLRPALAATLLLRLARAQLQSSDAGLAIATVKRRVLPLCAAANSPDSEALAWTLLGMAHRRRGELQRATAAWKDHALPLFRRLHHRGNTAFVHISIALALDAQGRRDAALRYLQRQALPEARAPASSGRAARARSLALSEIATTLDRLGASDQAQQLRADEGLPAAAAPPLLVAPPTGPIHTCAGPEIYDAPPA
jgi:tetratricopeptide (TPR) repeat protein